MKRQLPDFDGIARPYRVLEYATMGQALERARFRFLPELSRARTILVLGDGDGRFLSRLLEENREVLVTAVDISGEMLRLLKQRCVKHSDRLKVVQTDATVFCSTCLERYDVIVTHFFLDCFTQAEVEELVRRITPRLKPDGRWVLSEFHIPRGAMRLPARVLVRSLYFAFRLLTGLRTTRLPDYASALSAAAFERIDRRLSLGGVLTSELWRADGRGDGETISTSH